MVGNSSSEHGWIFDPTVVDRPIVYVPVTMDGDVIGYLWASENKGHASFVRRMKSAHDTLLAAARWATRLRQSEAEGLSPQRAVDRWRGAEEDPEAGGIAADARQRRAPDLRTLQDLANPTYVRSQPDTPKAPVHPGYASTTVNAVRYVPVTRSGNVLGYLWASETEHAAGYLQRIAAGMEGFLAGDEWEERLDESAAAGLTPMQALRRWIGAPEDPDAGEIAHDIEERHTRSMHALERLAYGINEEGDI